MKGYTVVSYLNTLVLGAFEELAKGVRLYFSQSLLNEEVPISNSGIVYLKVTINYGY